MTTWLHGKRGGLAAFVILAALVAAGLGWATHAALGLEREYREQRAATERGDRPRIALWRLDSRMMTILAREEARAFSHYSAVYAPPLALDGRGRPHPPGVVLELSPLLSADLPEWMLLHFQVNSEGWESPQVLEPSLRERLARHTRRLRNVTAAREKLLAELGEDLPPDLLLDRTKSSAGQATTSDRVLLARMAGMAGNELDNDLSQQSTNTSQSGREYASRAGLQSKLVVPQQAPEKVAKPVAVLNFDKNGEAWLVTPSTETKPIGRAAEVYSNPLPPVPGSAEVDVGMTGMVGQWLTTESGKHRLVVARLVRVEEKDICQGIVLDGERLMALLAEEVRDLFPNARVIPARDISPEMLDQTMTTLPLLLDPGADDSLEVTTGWTPLRVGLSFAWAAALVAMAAVALGGLSMLSLTQRRIRFVSAVTHELRTPLTTLRLYLDMLLGGMVRDEKSRQEYLLTMHAETDRLTRLVGNVLDYSRLESRSPKLTKTRARASEVVAKAGDVWLDRCRTMGKQLIVEDASENGAIETDLDLLQQVLANLIDNACKYSQSAADNRLWLRARRAGSAVVFEVEDRGPGVPAGEKRSIFAAFRRGKSSDATTGGVGLGLALARWWVQLLGGKLTLHDPADGGACFRVELPSS